MSLGAVAMMLLVLGLVWGGFAWLLVRSIRADRRGGR